MIKDKEQKKHDDENKALARLVSSKGWQVVRDIVSNKVSDLQSVLNVDGLTAEEVMLDVKVRKLMVKELVDFLGEVEGRVAQYESNDLSPDETYGKALTFEVPEE